MENQHEINFYFLYDSSDRIEYIQSDIKFEL